MTGNYWDGKNWLDIEKNNFEIKYYLNGELHRSDGPAKIVYNKSNIEAEYYFHNGKLHRENGPARILYNEDEYIIEAEYYIHNGKLHRKDGPAAIFYGIYGFISNHFFFYNGLEFYPEKLPFEMPIDSEEKEFMFNLKYGDIND
mgnify:CR=1 FL=1